MDVSVIVVLFIVIFGSLADMLVTRREYISKIFLILIAGILLYNKAFNPNTDHIHYLLQEKTKQEERIKALEEKQDNLEKKIEKAIENTNKPLILKRNQEK